MVLEYDQANKPDFEEKRLRKMEDGQLWMELELLEEYLEKCCDTDLEEKSCTL